MMKRSTRSEDQSLGLLHELERIVHRFRALFVAAPVLLLAGFAAGEAGRLIQRRPGTFVAPNPGDPAARHQQIDLHLAATRALHQDAQRAFDVLDWYRAEVLPVERALARRGLSARAAREISWPLVFESREKGLEPATVLAVLMVESGGKRTARSSVGARGLMQVMPDWAGHWRRCGRDLYDVEDNLCTGTSILAWYLRQNQGSERRALLGYNGCMRGTNTPNCFTYPEKVWRLREQFRSEMTRDRARLTELD